MMQIIGCVACNTPFYATQKALQILPCFHLFHEHCFSQKDQCGETRGPADHPAKECCHCPFCKRCSKPIKVVYIPLTLVVDQEKVQILEDLTQSQQHFRSVLSLNRELIKNLNDMSAAYSKILGEKMEAERKLAGITTKLEIMQNILVGEIEEDPEREREPPQLVLIPEQEMVELQPLTIDTDK